MRQITLHVPDAMLAAMQDVVEKRALPSIAEMLRGVFLAYYEKEFRKEYYGYVGFDKMKKTHSRSTVDMAIDSLAGMTDSELTAHLHDIGMFSPENLAVADYRVGVNPDSGNHGLYMVYKNGSGGGDVYDIKEIPGEVRKILAKRK